MKSYKKEFFIRKLNTLLPLIIRVILSSVIGYVFLIALNDRSTDLEDELIISTKCEGSGRMRFDFYDILKNR